MWEIVEDKKDASSSSSMGYHITSRHFTCTHLETGCTIGVLDSKESYGCDYDEYSQASITYGGYEGSFSFGYGGLFSGTWEDTDNHIQYKYDDDSESKVFKDMTTWKEVTYSPDNKTLDNLKMMMKFMNKFCWRYTQDREWLQKLHPPELQ